MEPTVLFASALDWGLFAALLLLACLLVGSTLVLVVIPFFIRSVLPVQPRRPVPWRGIDVLVLFLLALTIPATFVQLGPKFEAAPHGSTEHGIARVLTKSGSIGPIVACVLAAVVVAPIVEEFLFRLVLQGWLEALERRAKWLPRALRLPRGALPVAVSATLFAVVHIRGESKQGLEELVYQVGVGACGSLVVLACGLVILRFVRGATLSDLGIVPGKRAKDAEIGLVAFLVVTPPVYALFFAMQSVLPEGFVDPMPLFFLGLALGILYFRTHRIGPAIVLHMAFNTAAVLIALAQNVVQ